MRAIEFKDFAKTAAMLCVCLAFFAFIILWEWRRADFAAKVAVTSLFSLFSLLVARTLFIYRPRNIDVAALDIIRGPNWSSTILGTTFVWVDINHNGRRKRIRLVET